MTQDNLLSEDKDQVNIDENKDYFAELVGEGKKFKDEKALAKSKAYSDAHIAILERQNEELRQMAKKSYEDATAGAKLQDLLDKLEKTQEALASRDMNQNSNEDTKPALKLDEVESLVSSKIQQHEQSRREQDNFKTVQAKLTERFGANYKTSLKELSDSLGLTDDEVNSMARRNPSLFAKTFDLNTASGVDSSTSPPRSSMNNFAPKSKEKRGWAYYEKMKKENPLAWMDKKIAVQMERDAQEMGITEFYKN